MCNSGSKFLNTHVSVNNNEHDTDTLQSMVKKDNHPIIPDLANKFYLCLKSTNHMFGWISVGIHANLSNS